MSEKKLPVVELFVTASAIDKERKGSNPQCHQWFMAFYVLSEQGYCDLLVTTIVPENPPKYFSELKTSGRLPDVRVIKGELNGVDISNLVCDTNDEIEEFMRKFGCEDLLTAKESAAQATAEAVFANLYRDFNTYLQTGNSSLMDSGLKKLDSYLAKQGTVFLLGNRLSYADCMLLPKLQHLRVASKVFRDYEIDTKLMSLWRYLQSAYKSEAFQKSCPSDQDIVKHYQKKCPIQLTGAKIPSIARETYSFEISPEAKAALKEADLEDE